MFRREYLLCKVFNVFLRLYDMNDILIKQNNHVVNSIFQIGFKAVFEVKGPLLHLVCVCVCISFLYLKGTVYIISLM